MWVSLLALEVAAAAPIALSWSAPPSCPDGAEVEAQVRRLVGGETAGPVRLRAAARVKEGPPWVVRLTVRSRAGRSERRLEAESCETLAEAVAVILGLALERSPPPRAPLTPKEGRLLRRDASTLEVQLRVEAGVSAGAGHLPGASVGGQVGVGVLFGELSIGAGLAFWPRVETSGASARVEVGLLTAVLRAGHPVPLGPVELEPEVVVEVGRLDGRGLGTQLVEAAAAEALHASAGAGGRVRLLRFGPLGVTVAGRGQVALARPEFVVERVGLVWRPSALSFRAGLSLELRLP